ncbi:hypothetical protein HPB51_024601 [Rhipicephalus microplus]|uniref:Uncharacterized protein n=1 Tax=Rhipicephalus microplus TaxID=6941 RepID=A0A9J6EDL0_RHIMP|nr:hypothetical protein HPB51_024601 [Rhipicephalus microplus]
MAPDKWFARFALSWAIGMTIALHQTLSYARRVAPTNSPSRIHALTTAIPVTDLTQRQIQTALGVRGKYSTEHGCGKPSKLNCVNSNPRVTIPSQA